jgi:nucleoside-diphosphate-sugar epimerase
VRVFVTGARGFVGRWLVPRLERDGATVLGVDRELEISQASHVAAAIARAHPDAVVHLAAQSSVPAAAADPAAAYRANYLGTRAVLEAARVQAPKARVLLVSSAQVYGSAPPGAPPFDESAPLRPRSAYDWTKAAADLLGGAYAKRGLDVVRVRPFNHTGAGQGPGFFASAMARQIAEMEAGRSPPVLAVGNLQSVRDFLDVEDVVEAYVRLLQPTVPTGVYNVASGRGRTMRELLDLLVARAALAPEIRVDGARFRPTDVSVGTAAKLEAATGWRPVRPLGDTLGRLLDSWRAAVSAA